MAILVIWDFVRLVSYAIQPDRLDYITLAPLQYLRPELIGLVLGALASAFLSKEFKPRGGSAPLARISLGIFLRCLVRSFS